jgi:hypothetical protein
MDGDKFLIDYIWKKFQQSSLHAFHIYIFYKCTRRLLHSYIVVVLLGTISVADPDP